MANEERKIEILPGGTVFCDDIICSCVVNNDYLTICSDCPVQELFNIKHSTYSHYIEHLKYLTSKISNVLNEL